MDFPTASSGLQSTDKTPMADRPAQPVDDQYEDAEKNYQTKYLKFWMIMAGVYLATFLVALDQTIIGTAIPKITDEFNSIEDIGCNYWGSKCLPLYVTVPGISHKTMPLLAPDSLYIAIADFLGVRECLQLGYRLSVSHFWAHLPALLEKIGLRYLPRHL